MGVDTFQYGDDIVGYIKLESTFGEAVKPAATNAFRVLDMAMGQPRELPEALDRRKTRSVMETVNGRVPMQPWSCTCLFRPSGVLGVAPDISDLLKLAFGTESVVASTSVTYSLLKDMSGLFASIYRDLSSAQEGVYSAVCNNVTISWSGEDWITLAFSGVGKDFIEASKSEASGAGSGITALVVDDADFFTKYAIIQNNTTSDDNSGAGYQITAIDYDTETLTLGSAASWSNNDEWASFLPTGTFTGSPIYGTDGQLSLDADATTVKHLGGSVTIATGVNLLNREYGDESSSDVVNESRRSVTGTLNFLVNEDDMNKSSWARRKVAQSLRITLGDTAASRIKINCTNTELDPGQRGTPDTGVIELSLGFKALGTSGEDEIAMVLD